MTKVSVIVPVYNSSKYLNRCLDSLTNQTLKDIEIIVINDGSKDDSLKIINTYKKKYKNIVVIDQENKGISVSRNNGLDIAKGEYIGFVDSDDYVSLDMYEKLYKTIQKNNCDIVVCNYNKFAPNDENTYGHTINMIDNTNIKNNPSLLYEIDYAPWNKLYKRELWNDIRYPLNLKYEDINAVIKVFLKANKISYNKDYLYYYMTNPIGETQTVDKRVMDIISIFDDLIKYVENYSKEIKKAMEYLCVKKFFDYNQLIINTKNENLSLEYMKKVYEKLDYYYSDWKKIYIRKSSSIKIRIFRYIQCNKFLYRLYIKRKMGD